MILPLLKQALAEGARQAEACETLGLDTRTVQRWRAEDVGDDARQGPNTSPGNKLSQAERQHILTVVNSPAHRDLSPKQIVPKLADQGVYLASESTVYRLLAAEGQMRHRAMSRPPMSRPREHVATGPNQVWSWDITYLKSPIRGVFYYLYLVVDVWSRKIVARALEETESTDLAARMIDAACAREGIQRHQLKLHQDNGSPMKGATLLATLQMLGVEPSYSRPRVSNDNPFSESLFRTVKYRPEYPSGPFGSLEAARGWVDWFVNWYNTEHCHSAIRFVTPAQRHDGRERELLARRHEVYERARRRHPQRWSRATRNWTPIEIVRLNPAPATYAMAVAG